MFLRTGTVWAEEATLLAPDGERADGLGVSVSMSADGARALVGALRERRGLDPAPPNAETDRLAAFDAAADLVEAHLDLGGWL